MTRNKSGIDWNDPEQRRAYRRAWVNKGTNRGRPKGSGATTVRVGERDDRRNTGAKVFIGRLRWQQMGEPERVNVWRQGNFVLMRPSPHGYVVLGQKQDSIPRITAGEQTLIALGLMAGTYQTRMGGKSTCIIDLTTFVPLNPEPTNIRQFIVPSE